MNTFKYETKGLNWGYTPPTEDQINLQRENASAISKWLHEREETEIVTFLFKFHRETLDRLHRVIHLVAEEPK